MLVLEIAGNRLDPPLSKKRRIHESIAEWIRRLFWQLTDEIHCQYEDKCIKNWHQLACHNNKLSNCLLSLADASHRLRIRVSVGLLAMKVANERAQIAALLRRSTTSSKVRAGLNKLYISYLHVLNVVKSSKIIHQKFKKNLGDKYVPIYLHFFRCEDKNENNNNELDQ